MAPKAKSKKSKELDLGDLASFLPGKDTNLDEYLKDVPAVGTVAPKSTAKETAPEAPSASSESMMGVRPAELSSMIEKSMNIAKAQESSSERLAAPATALGIDKDFVTSEKGGGTYDYQTGMYFHPKALSSDLRHFEEFHRLHNLVSHALEKHSALQDISNETTKEGRSRRVGPFDQVDTHLLRASRAISDAMQHHMEGKAESYTVGKNLGETARAGAVTGFGNAIEHLKRASDELSKRTNGEFKGIHTLADNLHAGYQHHIGDVVVNMALAGDSQQALEAQASVRGDEFGDAPKPEAQRLPLGRKGYNVVRSRIRKAKDLELTEEAAGRRPRTGKVVTGSPREMFMAKPANVKLEMDWKPQENEVDRATGEAQTSERIRNVSDANAKELGGKIEAWRDRNRARVRSVLANPKFKARAERQRQTLAATLDSRATPFPQPESRVNAFRAQQEGTTLTTGKPQRGTSISAATSVVTDSVASHEATHRAIIESHIASGNIQEAALHHYKNLDLSLRPYKDKETGVWTDKSTDEIKRNPYRYLAKHGFDVGQRPRPEAKREEGGSERIRVRQAPAVNTVGEVVSRAKLNKSTPTAPRTAPSMFSTESAEQYEERQKQSRAERNNAAFRGE